MSRTVLRVAGPDREKFLQGLVTNDVAKLRDGLVYAALLTPQGKYLADFFLVPEESAILIDVDSELAAPLLQRLSMYKLRSDVQIEETDLAVSRGLGEIPENGFSDPRSAELGWRRYTNTASDQEKIDWDEIRVEHLIPETNRELFPNDSYILEMGFERLNGVDFKKGCYVGQEVTARMKHKTELKKGLAKVSVSGNASEGDEITSGSKPVGRLLTTANETALAYVRFDRATGEMAAGAASVELLA